MAIGFRGVNTPVSTSGNSLVANAPAGLQATDLSFLFIVVKASTITIPVLPEGWTKLLEATNGSTSAGTDTGSVRIFVFSRPGTYSNVNVQFSGTVNVAQSTIVAYSRASNEAWKIANYTFGVDSVHDANYSATGSGVLATTSGNWLIAMTGINSDAGTITGETITETGATFGGGTVVRADNETTTGGDAAIVIADAACTAGTGTNSPTFAYTNSSNTSGATAFLRLSVVTPTMTVTKIDPFHENAGYQIAMTGLDGYSQWELIRSSSFPDRYPDVNVHGGLLQITETSNVTLTDYDFHFTDLDSISEESLTYTLKLYNSGQLQDQLISSGHNPLADREASTGFHGYMSPVTWIKNLEFSEKTICPVIGEFTTHSHGGRVLASHNVLQRRNPVVISDVSSGMTGSFTIVVTGSQDFAGAQLSPENWQIEDLFATGSTYYFQTVYPYLSGIPDFYFQVESYDFQRVHSHAKQTFPRAADVPQGQTAVAIWTVNFIEVDRPTDADVLESLLVLWSDPSILNFSWGDVNTFNDNWADVLDPLQ